MYNKKGHLISKLSVTINRIYHLAVVKWYFFKNNYNYNFLVKCDIIKVGEIMKKHKKKVLSAFFLILITTFLDQEIKAIMIRELNLYESFTLVKNFLSLTLTYNLGAAFSILDQNRFILIAIAILVLVVLFRKLFQLKEDKEITIYALLISGIIGNLIDRIFRGYVVDYISIRIFGINMPIFNLADVLITLTILILLIKSFRSDLCKN